MATSDSDSDSANLKQASDDQISSGHVTNPCSSQSDASVAIRDIEERLRHLRLMRPRTDSSPGQGTGSDDDDARIEEVRQAPLFSRRIRDAAETQSKLRHMDQSLFPQYGFLGIREKIFSSHGNAYPVQDAVGNSHSKSIGTPNHSDQNMVYANVNAPWSAFICGSQGGGKSHTLSCLLENCLIGNSPAGVLPNPLAGIVFHYDKFTSHMTTQFCEAAYLCSLGIEVRVLVSPSNYMTMHNLYSNLPGLTGNIKFEVLPLYLQEWHLNVSNMMTLMAVNTNSQPPLYLGVLYRILRDMAVMRNGEPGVDYHDFKDRLAAQSFTKDQSSPLDLRLQLLESFLDPLTLNKAAKATAQPGLESSNIWQFRPGTLTIVDLSCPFVTENDACALFTICLDLFLQNRAQGGRVIALDEAHKFLTQSGEATKFTSQLTSIICQQRHLASRVIIATQEPTLSPRLLDLCNVTIVHRFLSPAWFATLRDHLAGAAGAADGKRTGSEELFRTIVALKTGEALVFSPTAILDTLCVDDSGSDSRIKFQEQGDAYFKLRVRARVTSDGGKSIMASDTVNVSRLHQDSISDDRGVHTPQILHHKAVAPRVALQSTENNQRKKQKMPDQSGATAKGRTQSTLNDALPSKETCEASLRRHANQSLNNQTKSFDFRLICNEAESELQVQNGYLQKGKLHKFSRDIIRSEAENWVEASGRPAPRCLTWMHNH